MADASVKTTVEPLIVAELTVTGSLPTNTVNRLVAAPTDPKVSLSVSVTVVPEAVTVLRVGGVTSGPAVEELKTVASARDTESLPEES
jgi:hypothetical protein